MADKTIEEILKILEERKIRKEWIIEEILKKNSPGKILENFSIKDLLYSCPTDFIDYILSTLTGVKEDSLNFDMIPIELHTPPTLKMFEFRLEITDPNSMMTHHTWIWNVKNTSEKPLDRIYYNIVSNSPTKFFDINLKITDEKGNMLETMGFDKSKPYQKKFYVELIPPITKNQKGKLLKLEYDCEEPARNIFLQPPFNCEKFKYVLSSPVEMTTNPRIIEFNFRKARGLDVSSEIEIEKSNDRKVISWSSPKSTSDINYVFSW